MAIVFPNATLTPSKRELMDAWLPSRSWFDGTAGARVRYNPAEKWHLFAKGDVGAGGSKLTWQAFGGLGWDVSGCCALMAAYKHLDVNYERDGLVSDNYTSGAALGFEIRF